MIDLCPICETLYFVLKFSVLSLTEINFRILIKKDCKEESVFEVLDYSLYNHWVFTDLMVHSFVLQGATTVQWCQTSCESLAWIQTFTTARTSWQRTSMTLPTNYSGLINSWKTHDTRTNRCLPLVLLSQLNVSHKMKTCYLV